MSLDANNCANRPAGSDFVVANINTAQTQSLRLKILRPGQALTTCHFDGDEDESTFHIGAIDPAGVVIGIATVMQQNELRYQGFGDRRQWRLRGMAVNADRQGQGIGREVLKACLDRARQGPCDLFWCNARQVAVDFYLKCGLSILNQEPFDIPNIGPHYVMYKKV